MLPAPKQKNKNKSGSFGRTNLGWDVERTIWDMEVTDNEDKEGHDESDRSLPSSYAAEKRKVER